ncbi:hypothetical protein ACPPVO_51255 [Dactylosporangium sp. McL0621]|uniref:hypothetical protein n=1 Tax=Dactylosporangium sp. McL0621 TaxID=3415678 RepID=UPI003CF7C336
MPASPHGPTADGADGRPPTGAGPVPALAFVAPALAAEPEERYGVPGPDPAWPGFLTAPPGDVAEL